MLETRPAPSADKKCGAEGYERRRQSSEQIGSDGNLLAGADQLSRGAERKCVIERYTHHRVSTFPAMDTDLEDLALLLR